MSALWASVVFAIAAAAIDLSRLELTATEVQSIADLAAMAGATALMHGHDAVADAQTVTGQNSVDGRPGTIAAQDVQVGLYDPNTRVFVPQNVGANAVRATPHFTVNTIMASIFGASTAQVTKTAIAMFEPTASSNPVLPIALGACNFQQFQTSTDCGQLPTLSQVPNTTNNTGWTSLNTNTSASSSSVASLLPSQCGGGGTPPSTLNVTSSINVANGQNSTVLQDIASCVAQGINTFLVPVIPCANGGYNGSQQVLGFATIVISSVEATGSNKGLYLSSICNTSPTGSPGITVGGNFGTGTVRLAG